MLLTDLFTELVTELLSVPPSLISLVFINYSLERAKEIVYKITEKEDGKDGIKFP